MCLVSMFLVQGCNSAIKKQSDIQVTELPILPQAMANNAVAVVDTQEGEYLVSFNGLASAKKWDSTTAHTFVLKPGTDEWLQVEDVPGVHGRLASIAVSVSGKAYVFGGYTVAENHEEVSLPLVHNFDPVRQVFEQLADMPVPVDDAMALVYQDRFIYLISGWHDTANVNLVQRYDIAADVWVQATAYPGAPVFGHSGGIVNNELIVCGGVEIATYEDKAREFVMNKQCYAAFISPDNDRRLNWRLVKPMPGAARYRMAAVGTRALGGVLFVGGSDNPYNYDGIGYNGTPSEPIDEIWFYEFENNRWESFGTLPDASMDHRGLLETKDGFVTVGGMLSKQRVTNKVNAIRVKRENLR